MTTQLLLALAAALLTALCQSAADLGSKAATRQAGDAMVLTAQWATGAALLTALCLVVYPELRAEPVAALARLTRPQFWPLLLAGGALNALAYYYFVRAFRLADASLVAPIVLATPALLLITSPIMVGERTPPLGAFGVALCVLGAVLLALSEPGATRRASLAAFLRDPGAHAMFLTAAIWSVTANIDKLGMQASTPLLWIAALTDVIAAFGLLALLRAPPERTPFAQLWSAYGAGAANAVGNTLQMYALVALPVPYVIAIKRLSALFTVLAGGLLLGESIRGRLLGAGVMLLGAIVIALARG